MNKRLLLEVMAQQYYNVDQTARGREELDILADSLRQVGAMTSAEWEAAKVLVKSNEEAYTKGV